MSSKTHELTREEHRALDRMAETSDFWSRIRASAAQYDGLKEKQYDLFLQQVERDAWRAGAQCVNGVPVRNKFRTGARKPRCADRENPYCDREATVVVGTYTYCSEHAAAARESLEQWKASRGATKDVTQKGEAAFSGDEPFDLSILDAGHVVILDVDKALYPSAYKRAFLLAFEQMRLYMIERIRRQDAGDEMNASLFVADEYAQVADASNMEMWRVSREANIAPLLAYQVHTDLQGPSASSAPTGCCRTWARASCGGGGGGTSDPASIALVSGGKAKVLRDSTGVSEDFNEG